MRKRERKKDHHPEQSPAEFTTRASSSLVFRESEERERDAAES